uniref:Tyrosinase copper-binding domain-containing protein n=1 Tax=Octactis speculum TaxID=3111310 RepID=A0A7S2HGD6_9STRA|mmetsp:Transcript_64689/g.88843  ORF Transcript_64689/g.88843 Transcript_64689/m.88843 type:complete len:229 (+) Transcript_64689:2-688(+)
MSGTLEFSSRLQELGFTATAPYYEQLWSGFILVNFGIIKALYRYDQWTCPESCSMDTPMSECSCSCNASAIWNNDTVRTALFSDWTSAWGNETTMDLIEMMCEMGTVMGDHATSGSSSDPSFWVIHGTVERWLDLLIIEDRFESQSWTADGDVLFSTNIHPYTSVCKGHNEDDNLLFGPVDGFNFTNVEYYSYLSPKYPHTPYVYDNFRWEHCAKAGYPIRRSNNTHS